VDLSGDLPSSRRPLFFPVVIATVFLSVIGLSAGLVLSSQHKDQGQGGTTTNSQPTTPPDTPASTAEPCRTETQTMGVRFGASGSLRIALKLRTAKSTVWICGDDGGRLYYHANRGGEKAKWIEGETALFLPDVQADGDTYRVTATDGTQFTITAERLEIQHKNGTVEVQKAAD
jgi:hypothetical protein